MQDLTRAFSHLLEHRALTQVDGSASFDRFYSLLNRISNEAQRTKSKEKKNICPSLDWESAETDTASSHGLFDSRKDLHARWAMTLLTHVMLTLNALRQRKASTFQTLEIFLRFDSRPRPPTRTFKARVSVGGVKLLSTGCANGIGVAREEVARTVSTRGNDSEIHAL
jgi:hypothetical protein